MCEGSFYSGRVPHTRCVGFSLKKKEDFLSPCVRESLYSGRVPHTRCVGFSLEKKKELPFTRCEGILVFWQSSPTPCAKISLWKQRGLPFTRCEGILLFWKRPLHQVWRDLFLSKRTSFHQVWENPFSLAEFTHTRCAGFSLERRGLPFTRCEGILLFWQSSPHHVWRDLSGKKRIPFHHVWVILLFWQCSPTHGAKKSLSK